MDSATGIGADGIRRCPWGISAPEYLPYHDDEWGRPVGGDVQIYEKLCLEGFQSGLSWLTILRKRDGFRRAFAGFDPAAVATFAEVDVARLLADPAIVRHRGKIWATIVRSRRPSHGNCAGVTSALSGRQLCMPRCSRSVS